MKMLRFIRNDARRFVKGRRRRNGRDKEMLFVMHRDEWIDNLKDSSEYIAKAITAESVCQREEMRKTFVRDVSRRCEEFKKMLTR